MGGLVVREAIRQTPSLKVRRVVLLNSPNYGSAAACLLPSPRAAVGPRQRVPQATQLGALDMPYSGDMVSL
jgi:hypothetical protein